MAAVGLGQQGSEAVGPGLNLRRVRFFYDFTEQNRVIPPLLPIKIFSIPEIFWKTGRFPCQVFRFGPVRQNFFPQYRKAPPHLCIKFFDTRSFLKHWMVPHGFFWDCDTKNFWRQTVIPPSLIHKLFSIVKSFWNTEGTPYEIFRSCETKFSIKPWCLPSYTWKFSRPECFWKTEGFSYEVFRYCETKIFERKVVIFCIKYGNQRWNWCL